MWKLPSKFLLLFLWEIFNHCFISPSFSSLASLQGPSTRGRSQGPGKGRARSVSTLKLLYRPPWPPEQGGGGGGPRISVDLHWFRRISAGFGFPRISIGFWVGFWFDFDFDLDFDSILIRFDFDSILIRFRFDFDWILFDFDSILAGFRLISAWFYV